MSRVQVIILNWRSAELSLRSARAALAAMEGVEGGVTLVDNASGDGSEELFRAACRQTGWDRVSVLQSGHNGGFGFGNNAAIRQACDSATPPDYLYILNPDAFPEPDTIRLLRDHLDTAERCGMVGSAVFGEDGGFHHTLFRFPSALSEFEDAAQTGPISRALSAHIVPLPAPEHALTSVDWVAGCSVMMRRKMLDEIGLFDEEFFLYFEETDLCRRAKDVGWRIDYLRAARVTHIGSTSTGMAEWERLPSYWLDSRRRYFSKHHGRSGFFTASAARLAGAAIWTLRSRLTGVERPGPKRQSRDLMAHLFAGLRKGKR